MSEDLRATIQQLAEKHHEHIVGIRRHMHMYPELSFHEEGTGKYIQEVLRGLSIPFTSGWAGHGVVGILECQNPTSAVIALRADMDALPILEQNDVVYKSRNPGVMHACGHDVHTSSLLGVAMILTEIKARIAGTVKFIFQPAEEKLPGGASMMISEGVLKDPAPAGILGQHVHTQLPAGSVGFFVQDEGMASSDEIQIRIQGKGGHGAMPHQCIDPVVVAAQVITGLQSIVSRSVNPVVPSVLTFGKINSEGGAFNVIPDAVSIAGTFRTFDESWRREAHEKIRSLTRNIAGGYGATCEVDIQTGYPVLVNDRALKERCMAAAEEYLGKHNVHHLPQRMTSEDFASYTHVVPGCFYRLGVDPVGRDNASAVHTPTFDIDEHALKVGAGLMAWLAVAELSHKASA